MTPSAMSEETHPSILFRDPEHHRPVTVRKAREESGPARVVRVREVGIGQINQVVFNQVLANVETRVGAPELAYQRNGKSVFRESLETQSDQSARAVADRLFRGISGYIFTAHCDHHSPLSFESFKMFEVTVIATIQRGIGEAREILSMLGGINDSFEAHTGEVLDTLHEQLDNWFAAVEIGFEPTRR